MCAPESTRVNSSITKYDNYVIDYRNIDDSYHIMSAHTPAHFIPFTILPLLAPRNGLMAYGMHLELITFGMHGGVGMGWFLSGCGRLPLYRWSWKSSFLRGDVGGGVQSMQWFVYNSWMPAYILALL